MAAKFNGFTQEEINKLAAKPDKPKKVQPMDRGIRRLPDKQPAMIDKIGNDPIESPPPVPSHLPNKQLPKAEESLEISLANTITSMHNVLHFKPLVANNPQTVVHTPQPVDESILHLSSSKDNEEAGSSPFRGISLKDFQTQQKMIQEQNKQKKELLHKAIEHHTQKTASELEKIREVKSELGKMDSDVAADIAILRKKIEEATIEFSNVRKAYDRVEATFLKAKLDLHQAGEKKELLTEHLCTVIAYNEDRKAKKLTELMEKVGLSPVNDLDIATNGNSAE